MYAAGLQITDFGELSCVTLVYHIINSLPLLGGGKLLHGRLKSTNWWSRLVEHLCARYTLTLYVAG